MCSVNLGFSPPFVDQSHHLSVMPVETIESLNIRNDGIYLDGTAGGGGHAAKILERLRAGLLIAVDRDPQACRRLAEKFKEAIGAGRMELYNTTFDELPDPLVAKLKGRLNGVLLDLGISSDQLDDPRRGFAFGDNADAVPLDMRMNQSIGPSAAELVNSLSEKELAAIFYNFGDESRSYKLARAVVAARGKKPLVSCGDLKAIVLATLKPNFREKMGVLARNFQALRIAVNRESTILESGLDQYVDLLAPSGRMAVITFHSGEDRVVKHFFKRESSDCICANRMLPCNCGHKAKLKLVTRKALVAGEEELAANPRARSAKLRVAEKI